MVFYTVLIFVIHLNFNIVCSGKLCIQFTGSLLNLIPVIFVRFKCLFDTSDIGMESIPVFYTFKNRFLNAIQLKNINVGITYIRISIITYIIYYITGCIPDKIRFIFILDIRTDLISIYRYGFSN